MAFNKIAQNLNMPGTNELFRQGVNTSGIVSKNPVDIFINLINWGMGFLGLVAVVLILWSGFEWMTSSGDDKKIGVAKNRMISAVIGLVIILASWSIAYWVVNTLATGIGTGTFN